MTNTSIGPEKESKTVPKKKKKATKFRKAPQAPKRFKSSFIFFSEQKHPEIRARLKEKNEKKEKSDVPNVAKLVSEEWRNISTEERAFWEKKATDDKKRYELERTMYTGPWKVPASKRAKKDPEAPKRPMSAFLAYSKEVRSKAKEENPTLKNTEISKLLAVKWKGAPEEERKKHIEQEAKERDVYKANISKWRSIQEENLKAQRKQREKITELALASGETNQTSYQYHDQGHNYDGHVGYLPNEYRHGPAQINEGQQENPYGRSEYAYDGSQQWSYGASGGHTGSNMSTGTRSEHNQAVAYSSHERQAYYNSSNEYHMNRNPQMVSFRPSRVHSYYNSSRNSYGYAHQQQGASHGLATDSWYYGNNDSRPQRNEEAFVASRSLVDPTHDNSGNDTRNDQHPGMFPTNSHYNNGQNYQHEDAQYS